MRYFSIVILALTMASCQSSMTGESLRQDQLEELLAYQQSLRGHDLPTLMIEAERLQQSTDTEDYTHIRVQLALLESEIAYQRMLDEQLRRQQALLQQIQSLTEQIQALTAIEQQINRRGQQQEINGE